jgi:hypothetical protein
MPLVQVLKFKTQKGKQKGQYDENALNGWNDFEKYWSKCEISVNITPYWLKCKLMCDWP